MSSEGLESVGLDLEGNFASKALADAAAGDKLTTTLGKLTDTAGKVKMPELVSGADRVKMLEADAKKASTALEKLAAAKEKIGKGQADLLAKKDTLTDVFAKSEGFGKLRGIVGKIFGDGAVGKLDGAAASLATAGEKIGITPAGLESAGGVLKVGAGAMAGASIAAAAAAAALVYGAVKILDSFVRAGVAATDAKNTQVAILDKLSGGKGEATFKLSMSLAGEKGVDPATALERVKGLMAAKFSNEEIPLLFKAAADLGAVKGEEKGKGLLEQLEKTANKGKANEESLNALAEAGVNATGVLTALAKKGESLDSVRARLKSGTVAAKDFAKAVGEAVEKDFGGIAGKGLDAAVARIKIKGSDLVSGFDLSPIEHALENVSKVLDGPIGAKMKAAFGKAGSETIKTLFGPFEGEAGRVKLEKLATAVVNIAENVSAAMIKVRPYVAGFVDLLEGALGAKADTDASTLTKGLYMVGAALAFIATWPAQIIAFFEGCANLGTNLGNKIHDGVASVGGWGALGSSIVDGIVGGITGGASRAIDAAAGMAKGALAKAKAELGIHSPSKEFAFLGEMSAAGFAKGANDNDAPAEAGANLGKSALEAAAGVSGGGSGGGARSGGGGGGNHYVFAPNLQVGAGAGPEVEAAVSRALAAAYPAFLAMVRKAERDAREAA